MTGAAPRRERRRVRGALALALLGLAGAPGCGAKGQYDLSWRFTDMPADAALTARDCGFRGVDAFSVVGQREGGDTDDFIVACGSLAVTREVTPGRWTLTVVGLALDGTPKDGTLLRASPAVDVVEGGQAQVVALLDPVPQCRDGVDNDGDGRVDLDDPDCADDPNGPSE